MSAPMSNVVMVPTLRFPEFFGDWEDKKGSQLFDSSRTKGQHGLPIYSVTQDRGLVPRNTLDRQMKGDASPDKNLRARSDDLVYNMMRMWQGAVGIAKEECMVSPAYVVLTPRSSTNSPFFIHNFERARTIYLLWAYSYGLTNDRLRLYYKDFAKIGFVVPSLPEQQKIASFLTSVDEKIQKLTQKQALLEQYKKGVMQKVFSQKIRFKADDGSDFPDWEEKRLGDVFSERSERGNENAELLSVTMARGVVKTSTLDRKDNASSDRSNYKTVHIGDIAYNSMRMWQGASGVSRYFGIVSPAYTVITPTHSQISDFWGYYFKLEASIRVFQRNSQGLTSDTWNLKYPTLSSIRMFVPQLKEQQKITEFLSLLDAKINAVTEQLSQMQSFKNGLLQKMFV